MSAPARESHARRCGGHPWQACHLRQSNLTGAQEAKLEEAYGS